jgi:bacterioferritin
MKGASKIIKQLNACLGNELIAINQYFLHARMCGNWGLEELNKYEYKKSIQDMKHADTLIERILLLEGLPNLQKLGKLLIGEDTKEILDCDLTLQKQVLTELREGIALCEAEADYVSRDILQKILHDEEEHTDWIETQQSLVKSIGIKNYMQSMMHSE